MDIAVITEQNFSAVQAIYSEGIATGLATFETAVPEWENWHAAHLLFGRIVAKKDGQFFGWASLSPVSSRCVYGGVAEVSVYVTANARGQGVGYFLLQELIKISEANGIWTLQSGIFPENIGSIALHQKCGFRKIGYREKVGRLDQRWHDNVLMERRSRVVGID